MRRPFRPAVFAVTIASLTLLAFQFASSPTTSNVSADVLQATDGLNWYRGNLHTHSLWSDGDDYLDMIALWYKEHDYDFLCFTDHNILANSERWIDVDKSKGKRKAFDKLKARFPKEWVKERTRDDRLEVQLSTFEKVNRAIAEPGKFLLIQGEEISDRFGKYPIHLNASNLKELIPPMRGESIAETIQNNVNALNAQRERTGQPMIIHLNHPNFGYAVTAEDLMRIRGEKFFEVYNGHPGVNDSGNETHASTERLWDIILTKRLAELDLPVMYGLATDDGHNYHNIPSRGSEPGRGWVMVLASSLEPAALIDAMENGRFYSSSGVRLASVSSSANGLEVAVEEEAGVTTTIEFIGTRMGYDPKGEPITDSDGNPIRATQKYSVQIGTVLKRIEGPVAAYEFQGDEIYVRAKVTSSKKHPNPSKLGEFERAWTQPAVGPAVRE